MDLTAKWEGFPVKQMLADSWKKSLNRFHFFLVPLLIMAVFSILSVLRDNFLKETFKEYPLVFWVGWAIEISINYTIFNYTYLLVRSLEKNDKTPWQGLLKIAFNRFWPVIGVYIWIFFLALLFCLFAILLGVVIPGRIVGEMIVAVCAMIGIAYFIYRYFLLYPVTVYETSGPKGSLRRNAQLIKGAFRDLFGVYLVFFLIFTPAGVILLFLIHILQSYQTIFLIFFTIVGVALMPFMVHYNYAVYTGLIQRENILRGARPETTNGGLGASH